MHGRRHLRDFIEHGFEVAMVQDATAACGTNLPTGGKPAYGREHKGNKVGR